MSRPSQSGIHAQSHPVPKELAHRSKGSCLPVTKGYEASGEEPAFLRTKVWPSESEQAVPTAADPVPKRTKAGGVGRI